MTVAPQRGTMSPHDENVGQSDASGGAVGRPWFSRDAPNARAFAFVLVRPDEPSLKSMPAPSVRGFSPTDLAEGFDLAPVGLCITQFRQIVCCNEEFCRIFGFEKGELQGHSLEKLYPTFREFDNTGKQVMPILRMSGRHSDDRLMKHRDGHLFWCHVAGRSFSTEEPFAHATWMFEDLSDRRKTNVLLTPREREVVKLLARGATSKEIARSLGISHRTVEAHRMRLGRKLEAGTTIEIVSKLAGLY